jgi:hypothetical protein
MSDWRSGPKFAPPPSKNPSFQLEGPLNQQQIAVVLDLTANNRR